ncbi:MAG: PDZ domain-containing protein [Phycisphaerales bacterium]
MLNGTRKFVDGVGGKSLAVVGAAALALSCGTALGQGGGGGGAGGRAVVVERAQGGGVKPGDVQIVMFKDGHRIDFSVVDGTPRYRLDGEWQGKNRWRNTPGGGFLLEDAEGEPLLEFTPEQSVAMGLWGGEIHPQVAAAAPEVAWVGRGPAGGGLGAVRVRVHRDGENERVEVERGSDVELEISTGKGVSVELQRGGELGWSVREYRLRGREMPATASRLDDSRLLFMDEDGEVVEEIALARLQEYAGAAGLSRGAIGMPGGMAWSVESGAAQPKVMIGIAMSEVPESLAAQLGLDDSEGGVLISSVTPGMPADKAGVRAQDVLVWLGEDRTPATFESVREVLLEKAPGDRMELELLRGGEAKRVEIELVERPAFGEFPGQSSLAFGPGPGATGQGGARLALVDEASRAVFEEAEAINKRLAEVGKELEASVRRLEGARGDARAELEQMIGRLSLEAAELSEQSRAMATRMSQRLAERAYAEALAMGGRWAPRAGGVMPQVLVDDGEEMLVFPEGLMRPRGSGPQSDEGDVARDLRRELEQLTRTMGERFERMSQESERNRGEGDRAAMERLERLERTVSDRQREMDRRLERMERLLEQLVRER